MHENASSTILIMHEYILIHNKSSKSQENEADNQRVLIFEK